MSTPLIYHHCLEFNDSLDTDGMIHIAGFAEYPSKILFEMDYIGYEQAYNEYLDTKFEELKDTIYADYPAIVAYHFRLSERGPGAGDAIRRLLHLKDTWEAIIFTLHAIVFGEVRKKAVDLRPAQVFVSLDPAGNPAFAPFNTGRIFSDALKQKLYSIRAVIQHSKITRLGLKCELIPEDLIDDLLKLQDIRNDISHTAAPTLQEAENELKQVIPLFRYMLPKTEFLKDCRIYRFESFAADCNCEEFRGYSLRSEFEHLTLPAADQAYVLALGREQLFLQWDAECYSLSPFLHFVSDGAGHETYLSVYKGKRDGEFQYEPVKLRTEMAFTALQTRFDAEKAELQNLIP